MPSRSRILHDESEFAYETRLAHYPSNRRARFAIELDAGWLDRLDLKVQDKIDRQRHGGEQSATTWRRLEKPTARRPVEVDRLLATLAQSEVSPHGHPDVD